MRGGCRSDRASVDDLVPVDELEMAGGGRRNFGVANLHPSAAEWAIRAFCPLLLSLTFCFCVPRARVVYYDGGAHRGASVQRCLI